MRKYCPYDTFDKQIERAQIYIDKCDSEKYKQWFQILLNILKLKKYATIIYNDGTLIDVERIAYTNSFASFFDVVNIYYKVNVNILPIETQELKKYYK